MGLVLKMTILTMCIDPGRGDYLAVCAEEPTIRVRAGLGEMEAIGLLVKLVTDQKGQCVVDAIHMGVDRPMEVR